MDSADDADPYLVDLMANEGRGSCTCRDWVCRCQPQLDKGAKCILYSSINRTSCKHYYRVIAFLGQNVAARLNGKRVEEIYDQG